MDSGPCAHRSDPSQALLLGDARPGRSDLLCEDRPQSFRMPSMPSLPSDLVTNRSKGFKEKIDRLTKGSPPRVLDLFAGCGGLSLGFQRAGYSIAAALELDPLAAESHANNLFKHLSAAERRHHSQPRDIREVEPEDICDEFRLGTAAEAFDVLVGGPPCQAFARVGRAKLREIASDPQAFRQDPRANLYLRYLTYVERLAPLLVVMENVPDVLNYGGHNIAEEMCEALRDLGYRCSYTLLNAAFFGVPQMRDRLFLVGVAEAVGSDPRFPRPTNWIRLPSGYHGTRAVALNGVRDDLFSTAQAFKDPPEPTPDLPPAVTAQEALEDLPRITLHLEGKLRRGARRFTELAAYPDPSPSGAYAKLMREWPGFEGRDGIYDHAIRYLPRDYQIFAEMRPGDQYPEAVKVAEKILERELKAIRRREGQSPEPGSAEYEQIKKSIVPPYDPTKFPNKWRKMEADAPARTLMAHLGKDGYSHIHYDSSQARTISVREAARLQSFPDGFIFSGTMNPAFRQIGNAVPPLLSVKLATTLRCLLPGADC